MTHISKMLASLRRPRIMIRAARAGVRDYRRERDLKRILRSTAPAAAQKALNTLVREERRLESIRVSGEATYSLQRHVAVLTAIIAEARAVVEAEADELPLAA